MDNAEQAGRAPEPEHLQLAAAMIDISEHIRRTSHEETGYQPLPNGMLSILRTVENHPGITVAELATRLDRQFSNVSTQLKDLVSRGLVTRNRDAADKRFVALHATPEAQRIKTLFESSWADALAEATARLPRAEQDQLLDIAPILARLASRFDAR